MKNYFLSVAYAIFWLAIGTKLLLINGEGWNKLGTIIYIIGVLTILFGSLYAFFEKFDKTSERLQYLFDSARHLDNERLGSLLHALGLGPLKTQEHKTSITIHQADHNNVVTNTRNIFNLPISTEQLAKLADALINQGVNYSRRELVGRGILTDQQHRTLQPIFEREGIVELKNTDNPNAGFKLSDYGRTVMQQYAPSPTPQMEEVQNPA